MSNNNNNLNEIDDEIVLEDVLDEIEEYFLNSAPTKPTDLYITARTVNTGIERGHLQYKIQPEILKKYVLTNIEDDTIIIEENTIDNLKRLLPKTARNGHHSNWKLILVCRYKDGNWLKGALLNLKTNLIALMTSVKGKTSITNLGHRAISSHDPEWFIGHYRLSAPTKFWFELIKRLNQDTQTMSIKDGILYILKLFNHLTASEIYSKIIQLKICSNLGISGSTPKATISAYCSNLFNENKIKRTSEEPYKYFLQEDKPVEIIKEIKSSLKDSVKDNIPKIKKQEIWEHYIGIDIGRTKCLCCNLNDINQFSFHNGHILAKSKGGDMSKQNLVPICSQCNGSMHDENMIDFMNRLKYDTSRIKKLDIKTEPTIKIDEKKLMIKIKMRNNQYGKHYNVFDTIRYTNKIICPWGHWKHTNILFDEGKFRNEKFSNIFINDIKQNDLICMFDREYDYGLILKITSDAISEKMNNMMILRTTKCSHKPMMFGCKDCSESVELIFTDKYFEENSKDFTEYLNEDYQFENIYAITRKVEIVGRVDDKCIFYKLGKKLQNSIARSNEEILEKDVYEDTDDIEDGSFSQLDTDSDDSNFKELLDTDKAPNFINEKRK